MKTERNEQNKLLAYGAPLLLYNDDHLDSLESTFDTDDYETADELVGVLLHKEDSPWKAIKW